MKKTVKAIAAVMLMVAVVSAAGCKKTNDPNNGGNINGGGTNGSNGALNGLFSVSATQQVRFSKGNLQYQASTNTWRFADNQFDYMGSNNQNISATNSGWIDLFGWGTGDNPTKQSTNDEDYGSFIDWGINAISNGGNQVRLWRTLTREEWDYVCNIRNTASGMHFVKAEVAGVNGVILLPDDWNRSYYTLYNTDTDGYKANVISQGDWMSILEVNGAVFLPSAGFRRGESVNYDGDIGYYWSTERACSMDFGPTLLYMGSNPCCFGQSVRLVRPVE